MILTPSTLFKLFFIIFFALFLEACTTTFLVIRDVETLTQNQRVVFGKFDLEVDGKSVPWKSTWRGRMDATVLILQTDSSEATLYPIAVDGSFYWELEPGDYLILGFMLSGKGSQTGRIRATFTVSEGIASAYIGNFKVLMNSGTYKVSIENDYLAAAKKFKDGFPNAREPIKTLALEEEKLGIYQRKSFVCANEWGINCNEKQYQIVGFIRYQGIIPVNPEVSATSLATLPTPTNSLAPTFEWNPSSRDAVSYDLVVYEAAFSNLYMGQKLWYMPGRLVTYKENIKETKFRLKDPLKPHEQYYWSVRLRKNNIVSTWSKFAHFHIGIFQSLSGSNRWFMFETPSK